MGGFYWEYVLVNEMCWRLNKWSHFTGFVLHINFGGGCHRGFPGQHHLKCSKWAKTQYNCSTSSQFFNMQWLCSCLSWCCHCAWLCLHPRMEAEDKNKSTFSSKTFSPKELPVSGGVLIVTGAVVDWPSGMLEQILVGHYIVEPVRRFRLQPVYLDLQWIHLTVPS